MRKILCNGRQLFLKAKITPPNNCGIILRNGSEDLPIPYRQIDFNSLTEFWSSYWPDTKSDLRLGQAFCNFYVICPFPEFYHCTDEDMCNATIDYYVRRYCPAP